MMRTLGPLALRTRRRSRRIASILGAGIVTAAGALVLAAPSEAVTANCTTGKIQEIGWANCTGSGGYFRVHLDCPWSLDFYGGWARLQSTTTYAQGTCEPWTVRTVYVETKPG